MTEPLLRVRGLTKQYGRVRALAGVSFDVNPGEIVAILGPNGAGKTTSFRCILGITGFDGEVELEGKSVANHGKEVRRRIGYVPQVPDMADGDTCAGFLAFTGELRGLPKLNTARALDAAGLRAQANISVGHLSGGMKQRLAFAAALLSDPPLLLLDEPTSSLDARSQEQFHNLIVKLRPAGKTAIIATHYASRLAGVADRAIVLDAGRLVFAGSMTELLQRRTSKSFIVNLNGDSVESFHRALAGAGVSPNRIRPVDGTWDDLIMDVIGSEAREGRQR